MTKIPLINKEAWIAIKTGDVLVRESDGLEREVLGHPTWPSGAVTLRKIRSSRFNNPNVVYFWNDLKHQYRIKQP